MEDVLGNEAEVADQGAPEDEPGAAVEPDDWSEVDSEDGDEEDSEDAEG
jgi:hypothetical protein